MGSSLFSGAEDRIARARARLHGTGTEQVKRIIFTTFAVISSQLRVARLYLEHIESTNYMDALQ